jgi:hypothetical protein
MSDNNEGVVRTYSICVDCVMFHANGEVNPNWGDVATADYFNSLTQNLDDVIVLGVGEQTDEFSTGSCDSCGSRLAGSRHELFVQPINYDATSEEN